MEARHFSKWSRGRVAESALVFLLVLFWLSFTASTLSVPWDEGYTFDRTFLLGHWIHALGTVDEQQREDLWEPTTLQKHWLFSKEEPDGHGPFYGLLSLAGLWATERFLSPPLCHRFGEVFLASLTLTLVHLVMRWRWGHLGAWLSVIGVAASPRLMPELSFALIDGPLVCLALLVWVGFVLAVEENSWAGRILFGVALGLAMATKLTGWFLPVPYMVWTLLDRRRLAWKTLGWGAVFAVVVLFTINVGWWYNPLDGLRRFLVSNLTRRETIPIPILFLGTNYLFALPWYNTLVWTVVATPVGVFLAGLVGIGGSLRRWSRETAAVLLVLNWGMLMVLRALPQAPGHDGVRQLAIAFACFALLAGYGVALFTAQLSGTPLGYGEAPRPPEATVLPASSPVPERKNALPFRWVLGTVAGGLLAIAVAAETIGSCLLYHPVELSYYSPLVGGLPGATKLGFEPTYFWDAVTPEVCAWLAANTPPERYIMFRYNPTSLNWMEQWGMLRVRHRFHHRHEPPCWFVFQHRPGMYTVTDRWLMEHGTPAFQKKLFGVPLISVFSHDEVMAAQKATEHERDPQEQLLIKTK